MTTWKEHIEMTLPALFRAFQTIKWRECGVRYGHCPVCGGKRIIVRLYRNEIGIRCLACRSTSVTMSLVSVLRLQVPDLAAKEVYELSSRGPLVHFLKNACAKLTCSEYLEGVEPGEYANGVQCQDVQCLTFADNSFDVCTSTEVFEHVPDDLAGFAEIRRVLKPGGMFIFSVPVFPSPVTLERARLQQGKIEHLRPPQFHSDPVRAHNDILVFRDYGRDILQRLRQSGFAKARFIRPEPPTPFGCNRPIISAC